ncbi:MAG: hypothetical protein EHM21_04300, partial [Chloroflexi bacterium]
MMSAQPANYFQPGKVVRRDVLVAMLRAALLSGDLRFARQAALGWLAAFPGDIEVTLLQAQVIIAAGRPAQAISALETTCQKDPFSVDAYRVLARACQFDRPARYAYALTNLFILDGRVPGQARLEPWGMPLRQAYLALEAGEQLEAESRIQEALNHDPDLLLAAVLQLLIGRGRLDAQALYYQADLYHNRWP